MSARFNTLQDWLGWQETLHPTDIELGLERIASVFKRLHRDTFSCPVITLAGTNGKGSSLRMLESIYRADGYRVGAYSSPHLQRYNERIRLEGQEAQDAEIVAAFARIDAAREDISLTYFEFGTLAALDIFMRRQLDVVLLEVGLGGRLDAVNIIDADVAVLTAIGLDHTDWLGPDREAIGFEKAGILRPGRPAVCSDVDVPQSVLRHAAGLGSPLYRLGKEFDFERQAQDWRWHEQAGTGRVLPPPALRGAHQYRNAAGVIMAIELLQTRLPVSRAAMRTGLLDARLAGRFQVLNLADSAASWIYDVAHNPDSVQQLAQLLKETGHRGRTRAILGMLADKDSAAALAHIASQIDDWHVVGLNTPRSEKPEKLRDILLSLKAGGVSSHGSVAEACRAIEESAQAGDRIVVFGSFYTVSEVMALAPAPGQRI